MNTTENKAVIHGKHSNVEDFVVPPDVDPMLENVDHWIIRSELEGMDRNLIPRSSILCGLMRVNLLLSS